jgi:integrase/recombinase XerD
MSALSEELDRYLTIRRGLGYDLGTTERVLRRFIAFAGRERAEHISTDLFLRWQETFGRANRQTWSRRLSMVRLFAQWLHGIDQKHETPPHGLIPGRYRRVPPYIYRNEEIRRIVEAAAELSSINGIRSLTCPILFGLIAVTGLRVSEALSLDVADVDLEAGVLTLRRGKLGKARLLPLSVSTTVHWPPMPENGIGFSAPRRNRFSSPITVSVLPTAAPDTTSRPSARPSGCVQRKSFDGMGAALASMICGIPSPSARW